MPIVILEPIALSAHIRRPAVAGGRPSVVVELHGQMDVEDYSDDQLAEALEELAGELEQQERLWLAGEQALLAACDGSSFELPLLETQPNAVIELCESGEMPRRIVAWVTTDTRAPIDVRQPLPTWYRIHTRLEVVHDEESAMVCCNGMLETTDDQIEGSFTIEPVR